jgi:hypothetical protein
LVRLWVIISNRHSRRTLILPRRWKREKPLLCLVLPNNGSTVCLRFWSKRRGRTPLCDSLRPKQVSRGVVGDDRIRAEAIAARRVRLPATWLPPRIDASSQLVAAGFSRLPERHGLRSCAGGRVQLAPTQRPAPELCERSLERAKGGACALGRGMPASVPDCLGTS